MGITVRGLVMEVCGNGTLHVLDQNGKFSRVITTEFYRIGDIIDTVIGEHSEQGWR